LKGKSFDARRFNMRPWKIKDVRAVEPLITALNPKNAV
jgi:hypothetical protein